MLAGELFRNHSPLKDGSRITLNLLKMKKVKLFFVVLLGVFLFVSCDQELTIPESSNSFDCVGFSSTELESIGITHNQYLTEVYESVDFSACDNCRDAIIEEFKGLDIDVSGLGISLDSLINQSVKLYDELGSTDIRAWVNTPFNETTQNYLNSIMDKFDNATTYSGYLGSLNNLQTVANNDNSLSCFDLEVINGTIEVAKNSAYLWMPQSAGGLDYYSISHQSSVELRWSWRNAFASDVASAAASMFELAGVLALTSVAPPANAVIAIGIGINAAVGSAIGGAL